MRKNKPFKPVTMFYHVTPPENVAAIEREGLRANEEGTIYAFTDLIVADCIAEGQVFSDPYALFAILGSGVNAPLLADEVAEMSSPLHCVIRQDRIEPRHLCYLGTWPVYREGLTPWQRMRFALMGLSHVEVEAMEGDARRVGKEGRHVGV